MNNMTVYCVLDDGSVLDYHLYDATVNTHHGIKDGVYNGNISIVISGVDMKLNITEVKDDCGCCDE